MFWSMRARRTSGYGERIVRGPSRLRRQLGPADAGVPATGGPRDTREAGAGAPTGTASGWCAGNDPFLGSDDRLTPVCPPRAGREARGADVYGERIVRAAVKATASRRPSA